MTDRGLKELKELEQLRSLEIDNTNVTDAGLTELKGAGGWTMKRWR